MNRSVIFLIVAFIGRSSIAAPEDIGALLTPISERRAVPGLAAAAIRDGTIIAAGVTGVRALGSSEKIALDDKWHIGSCTKSMTASLAAILVEEGKLTWDATVEASLPSLRTGMRPGWQKVTLEQLLRHRAGAPGEAPGDLWRAAGNASGAPRQQRVNFVRGLLARDPEAEPGSKFVYSNQGYAIAGAMIEHQLNKGWEELMQQRLFAPLGMKSAGFGPPGSATRVDQPRGHRRQYNETKPVPPGKDADNPAAIGPAGTVHCSIEDFARYAGWHALGESESPRLLSKASFEKLHTAKEGEDYAMGWGVTKRGWAGGTALSHSGSNTMWFAVMWVAPAKQAAFVAATNIAGDDAAKACDDAVAALIQRFLK